MQSWRVILHAWPAQGRLTLPLAPAREVLAVRVYDADNVAHAIDAEAFVVDVACAPGVVSFPPWAVPAPGRPLAGIELDVAFGYGDAAADVPEPLRQAVRLLLAQAYDNRGFAESAAPVSLDALIAPYKALTL